MKTLLFSFIVTVLATFAFGKNLSKNRQFDSRIVGGENATIEEFPYQVSLQLIPRNHICGGSILSSNVILTAAHCVNKHKPNFIRVGSTLKEEDGIEVSVQDVVVHEAVDAALVLLAENLTFSSRIAPIGLPEVTESLKDGDLTNVTGWGDLSDDNWISTDILQKVQVPIANHKKCVEVYSTIRNVTSEMICAGYFEGGKGVCYGDSGGPLVANGKVYGIVSWGYGCAIEGYPQVYTKVTSIREWIRSKVNL